jgi:L-rhamnonate dehydratase
VHRRSFLASAAVLGVIPRVTPNVARSFFASAAQGAKPLMAPAAEARTKGTKMKITAVELWQLTGDAKQYRQYLEEQYPKLGLVPPTTAPSAPARVYMKISTDAGFEGLNGPFEQRVINEVLNISRTNGRGVLGMDPLAIDTVWESMVTGDNRYTGMYMFAVGCITNTLWDLKGRVCGLPVYRLLGGSRNVLPCYATGVGATTATLDVIAADAARVKKAGFMGQKWFPSLGPLDGPKGLEFNIELMRTLREVLGKTDEIIIDPLTRWDYNYSAAWCKAAEQYRPRWLEEPVQTYLQTEPLARLRAETSVPISTGEHNYNRWDYHELMKAGAVDVINPDPEWIGISEVTKICALASAWGVLVSPHNMTMHPLAHLVASQPPQLVPWFENKLGGGVSNSYFEKNPLVYDGKSQIELSDRPGFGIELDDSKITNMKMIYAQS